MRLHCAHSFDLDGPCVSIVPRQALAVSDFRSKPYGHQRLLGTTTRLPRATFFTRAQVNVFTAGQSRWSVFLLLRSLLHTMRTSSAWEKAAARVSKAMLCHGRSLWRRYHSIQMASLPAFAARRLDMNEGLDGLMYTIHPPIFCWWGGETYRLWYQTLKAEINRKHGTAQYSASESVSFGSLTFDLCQLCCGTAGHK